MHRTDDQSISAVELALRGLQEERLTCVRRLEALLRARGARDEVEGYMRRIDDINAALIRLAGACVAH